MTRGEMIYNVVCGRNIVHVCGNIVQIDILSHILYHSHDLTVDDVNYQDVDGISSLFWATFKNHKSLIRALINYGANVDIQTTDGTTPLMLASAHKQMSSLKILLDAGCDLDIKNKDNKTALDFAIKFRNDNVVTILKEHQHLKCVVRPEVLSCLGMFPVELSEICGDYITMTAKRRFPNKND